MSANMSNEQLAAKLAELMAVVEKQATTIAQLQTTDSVKVHSAPIRWQTGDKEPSQPFIRLERFSMGKPTAVNVPVTELERVIAEMQTAAKQTPVIQPINGERKKR